MPEDEVPIDIERFLDRLAFSCSEPEFVHIRQEFLCNSVKEMANAYDDGWELLRSAALRRLSNPHPEVVERAVACLFVVGRYADAEAVAPLRAHSNEAVSKAARTCHFELRKRQE